MAEHHPIEITPPDITPYVDVSLISGVYADDRTVIWPGAWTIRPRSPNNTGVSNEARPLNVALKTGFASP